jgi:DNA-binding transcriptional regulator YiaG
MTMKADEIKDIRQKLGLTQLEMAEKLGCRRASVSDWETGRRKILPAYAKLIEQLIK